MNKKIQTSVIKLSELLKEKHFSLVSAESCTGGGLAYHLSKTPACSPFLERAYVTYSNQAKEELLEVESEILQTHGAVSKPVVMQMAEGALKHSHAQISIAITGMDESGNEAEKAGKVWIGCTGILGKSQQQFKNIKGEREIFCDTTIEEALNFLIAFIEKNYSN